MSAGSISTSKITIMDGTTPAFRWDTNGITAYWSGKDYLTPTDNPVLKMNRFVRFDKFGIYGYNNNNDNDNTNFVPASEEEIRSNPNSMFSLTWSGLLIRSVEKKGNTEVGSIEINNKYDIVVKKGDKNKIQIGRLNDNGNYGIRICDNDGKAVLETVDDGSLWLRKSLSIGTGTNTNVKIGVLDNNQVFNANNNFIVNKDGSAKMTGELKIEGTVYDLWIKNDSTNNIGTATGMFVYPKGKTSNSLGWVSINANNNGASYIEITSWGADASDSTKNGNLRLLSSGPLNINGHGKVSITSQNNAVSIHSWTGFGFQNDNTEAAITDQTLSGKWSILPGIETNSISTTSISTTSISAKTVTLDPLPNDNNWASYNLNSNGNLVKFGINGDGLAVIESWIGGNMARLELYVNTDYRSVLMLKSKKKGDTKVYEHLIGTT